VKEGLNFLTYLLQKRDERLLALSKSGFFEFGVELDQFRGGQVNYGSGIYIRLEFLKDLCLRLKGKCGSKSDSGREARE
jgi:hypothetical protein